jgi:hypothetical protein
MDVVQTLKEDYSRFPKDQTYSIYAEDVYFKDPMSEFRGCDRYKLMIQFIDTFFINTQMDLHHIQRNGDTINTQWTLNWNTPLPWKPRIRIDGWSELKLNSEDQIISHIDYWHCSRLDVLKQHFGKREPEIKR